SSYKSIRQNVFKGVAIGLVKLPRRTRQDVPWKKKHTCNSAYIGSKIPARSLTNVANDLKVSRSSNGPAVVRFAGIQRLYCTFALPAPPTSARVRLNDEATSLEQMEDRGHLLSMIDHYEDATGSDHVRQTTRNLNMPRGVSEPPQVADEASHHLPSGRNFHQHSFPIAPLLEAIRDENRSVDEVYDLYRTLPQPGILHIGHKSRSLLLRRLSVVGWKNEKSMLRYLSVLEDMKEANIPISIYQWSHAVHLAGRSFSRITSLEVEAALRIWREMEDDAGVQSNAVTFNILFDIATKAGHFFLADMILEEMKRRSLILTRFSYVSIIYYHGAKGDGIGIRESYEALVYANQLVDTAVLNCVIASFLRAGELPAAMNVYSRMRSMYRGDSTTVKKGVNRTATRTFGRTLSRIAANHATDRKILQSFQNKQDLIPDMQTYIIIVRHHVTHTGDLHSIATILDQMHEAGVSLHGRLFLELFRGFSKHGNQYYTSWTQTRLIDVWIAFKACVDGGMQDVYVAKWMAIWILRAFDRCFGRSRSLQVWAELKSRSSWGTCHGCDFDGDLVVKALNCEKPVL
ncbi:MAG: hypothetical protein MMC23_010154, partial [Stictis urceolatum]|nr:hypothetical protein [Stictis urceolata]